MKTNQFFPLLLICFLVFGLNHACTPKSPFEDQFEKSEIKEHPEICHSIAQVMMAAGPATSIQESNLNCTKNGVLVEGESFPPNESSGFLKRTDNGISYVINTSGLPPGAYTNWWVIFNNPAGCNGDCDKDDVLNAFKAAANGLADPANISIFWAAGKVVDQSGKGNFKGKRKAQLALTGPPNVDLLGPGLIDPIGSEVHIMIKYHGPADPDSRILYQQLNTVDGECACGANGIMDPLLGPSCIDLQFFVFLP